MATVEDPIDLSILYVEDGVPWCEYLCGQFDGFEKVSLFWENITDLPLNDEAAKKIKNSKAQMIIVTPKYVEVCSDLVDDIITNPIAFLCGVEPDSEDMAHLTQKLYSVRTWQQMSATDDMKAIISNTFQIIDGVHIPDDPNYIGPDQIHDVCFPIDPIGIGPDIIHDDHVPVPYDPCCGPEAEYVDVTEGVGMVGLKNKADNPAPEYLTFDKDFVKQLDKHKMIVQPDKVICGSTDPLLIVFKTAHMTDTTAFYKVKFIDQRKRERDAEAVRVNDFCLAVKPPPDQPPGKVTVRVFKQGVFSDYGEIKIVFQDRLQHLSELLQKTMNPLELLCQALDISPMDVNKLDEILTASYKRSMPVEGLDKLTAVRHEVEAMAKTKETPTLVHFAAKYGLQDLLSLLLNSPGAFMSIEITNCNDDLPNDIARQAGHIGLADFLENWVECGALMEEIFGQRVIYDQLNQNEEDEIDDDQTYIVMHGGPTGYYNTGPQFEDTMEGIYNVPFIIPIPAVDPLLELKSDKIKEIITGDEEEIENIYDVPRGLEGGEMEDSIYSSVRGAPFKLSYQTQRVPSQVVRRPGDGIPDKTKEALGGMSDAQQKLIAIQKDVKNGILTIEQAVHLFEAFKLNEKDKFLSFKNQKELVIATKESLRLKKAEKNQVEQRVAAQVEQVKTADEKTKWHALHRRMTHKPGSQLQQRKRNSKGSRPPSDEFQNPITREGSTNSSGSSRHSRTSIKSTDSGMFVNEEPDQEDSSTLRVPMRNKGRSDQSEKRLSTNLKFNDDYLNKPVPAIPTKPTDSLPNLPPPPPPPIGPNPVGVPPRVPAPPIGPNPVGIPPRVPAPPIGLNPVGIPPRVPDHLTDIPPPQPPPITYLTSQYELRTNVVSEPTKVVQPIRRSPSPKEENIYSPEPESPYTTKSKPPIMNELEKLLKAKQVTPAPEPVTQEAYDDIEFPGPAATPVQKPVPGQKPTPAPKNQSKPIPKPRPQPRKR